MQDQPAVFDSGATWRLIEKNENGLVFALYSPLFGDVPYKVVRFDHAMQKGEITFHRDFFFNTRRPVVPLEYPLDELILVRKLAMLGGVELHACGVEIQNNAALFIGHSGAGKSTIGNLLKTHTSASILSDDRIVAREFAGCLQAFGTPWHGTAKLAQAKSSKIAALFLLRQASSNCIRRLGPAQAVARLAACSFMPVYDRSSMANCLGFLEHLSLSLPVYELGFYPDEKVVGYVLKHAFPST
ncbi:MAG: hypothetical protein IPJ88_08365 [Myxococcales bacterium]|nr:MAG: hypothetical protein IPJ88_08365 [Myxococcales bacterium]